MEWLENLKQRRKNVQDEMSTIRDLLSVAFSTEQWIRLEEKLKEVNQIDQEMSQGLHTLETKVNTDIEANAAHAAKAKRMLELLNKATRLDGNFELETEENAANQSDFDVINIEDLPELPTQRDENVTEPPNNECLASSAAVPDQPINDKQDTSSQLKTSQGVCEAYDQRTYDQSTFQKTLQNVLDNSSSSMSKTMMNIDKCVPAEGNTIRLSDWTRWKAMLMMSIKSFKNSSEEEKQIFFLRNCGSILKDVLDEQLLDSSDSQSVFQESVNALDKYFTSETVVREAKETFKNMFQKEGEENVDFLARLFKFAKNCRYTPENFNENFMDNVARRSSDADIRKEAMTFDRTSGDRCSYKQLRNFAIQLESSRRVEAEINVNKPSTSAGSSSQSVCAITQRSFENRSDYVQKADKGWVNTRSNSSFRAPRSGAGSSRLKIDCAVCGSFYHQTDKCFHASKSCNACGEIGHLKIKCRKRAGSSFTLPGAKVSKVEVSSVESKLVRNEDE